MKLRIMGTPEEVQKLTELLPAIVDVRSISSEYPNRGMSKEVRVYVDCYQKAEEGEQQKKEATLSVTSNSTGISFKISTDSKSEFMTLMFYLTSDKFKENLKITIEDFLRKERVEGVVEVAEEILKKMKECTDTFTTKERKGNEN